MKVKELKDIIDAQLKVMPRYSDWEVEVKISKTSVGSMATSKVDGAGFGFDWNHGKFIIFPEKKLIEKPKP